MQNGTPLWSPEMKQALGYADIYDRDSEQNCVAMPFTDYLAMFTSTVTLHGMFDQAAAS